MGDDIGLTFGHNYKLIFVHVEVVVFERWPLSKGKNVVIVVVVAFCFYCSFIATPTLWFIYLFRLYGVKTPKVCW